MADLHSKGSSQAHTPDSLVDRYDPKNMDSEKLNGETSSEHSDRWIHRDKLAQIESQELQAAGITLPQPRSRAQSKSSRREQSRDQQGNGARSEGQKRQKVEALPADQEESQNEKTWDLRTPEEASESQGDFYQDISGGMKGMSRIPIAKTSPLPIPTNYLERNTPVPRKSSGGPPGENESISFAKSRGRSHSIKMLDDIVVTPVPAKGRVASGSSPTKKTPTKKATPTNRNVSAARPKTRGAGGSRDISGARPNTRDGLLGPRNSLTKRPEGDPPWLGTMFKPDPRLPPDQQILPTVAKRRQQEKWEKEGKFGNVYDTSFRPLNCLTAQPEYPLQPIENPPPLQRPEPETQNPEWPLRGQPLSTPASPSTPRPGTSGGGGSYSTMPKITTVRSPPPQSQTDARPQGQPQGLGPQKVTRTTTGQKSQRGQKEEEEEKTKGCCCVMM